MQSITRRGHLALAGLIGALAGILVISAPGSPMAISAAPTVGRASSTYDVRQVLPGDMDTGVSTAQPAVALDGSTGLNARQILPGDTDINAARRGVAAIPPGWGDPAIALEMRWSNSR